GWQTWTTVSCPVTGATGTHDLYLKFTGGSGYLFNLNWWQFTGDGPTTSPSPTPPTSPSPTPPASPSPSPSPSPTITPTPNGGACNATYRTTNTWSGGYQGEITVTAGNAPINGWTVKWTLGNGQTISQVWNGTLSTAGSAVSVTNASYNGSLQPSASTTFGFLAGGTPSTWSLTCTAA
ncbi:cellulose binding domain-containing protein, partial [Microbispora sp. NBRC 16548]|uniref:cellulose binding domain-containing protein n=1 Tax=Microbispora sp. NBRC 16548 TaxID=3030994 RepID=UPI002555C28E